MYHNDYTVLVKISIHAPVKGATQCRPAAEYPHRHFNPRTREGCDSDNSRKP